MNYQEYHQLFEIILKRDQQPAPYNDPFYLKYVKLNQARVNRWDKHLQLSEEVVCATKNLQQKQHWILITEPWCGDAAHSIPFLVAMAQLNSNISYDLQLRDSAPFLINSYLTGTSKSIPKLIIRNRDNHDLMTWGPRPIPAQHLVDQLKAGGADYPTISASLQNWYNQDKGQSLCSELAEKVNND